MSRMPLTTQSKELWDQVDKNFVNESGLSLSQFLETGYPAASNKIDQTKFNVTFDNALGIQVIVKTDDFSAKEQSSIDKKVKVAVDDAASFAIT